MKSFSVPADFKKESILEYQEIGNSNEVSVKETYGQLTEGGIIKSGRIRSSLPQIDMCELEKYVDFSLKNGIKFNYTFNPACMGNYEFTRKGIMEIKAFLKDLCNIGITDITVTSPALIEIIKKAGFNLDVKVSAINHVDSVPKLQIYRELGVKRVVVEPDIYRNFSLLENLKNSWGDGLELIVNDICYRGCPYKIYHYNHEAHCEDCEGQVKNYFFMRCGIQKSQVLRNYLKLNWIRPEDLELYEKVGISNFKIQGRGYVVKGDIMRVLKCYANQNYEGNLLELIHLFAPYDSEHQPYIDNKKLDGFVKAFFNKKIKCDDICDNCKYCDSYAEKALRHAPNLLSNAVEFYNSQDEFTKMIKSL